MCTAGINVFVRALAVVGAVLMAVGLAVAVSPPEAAAQEPPSLPPGFALRDLPSGQGTNNLTDFAYLPDDGGILTIGKKGTVAWVPPEGEPRIIRDLPVDPVQDLGLVGLAVAPDFATSGHIYLARSFPRSKGQPTRIRLARWTVTGNPAPTGLTDERTLLEVPVDGDVVAHGMTGIVAADDGTLWVSIGDLSPYGRVDRRALRAPNPDYLEGKILHLTAAGNGVPGNPYYDAAKPGSTRSKVYAGGFRSPFRFSLDARTGLPVVGDVGNERWEEIDVVQPGRSYGWPCWEARERTAGFRELPECAQGAPLAGNTEPLVAFAHGDAGNQARSITGGIRYTGTSYPDQYHGAYFFGDYAGDPPKLWTLRYDGQGALTEPPGAPFGISIGSPVQFRAAPNGDIVFADFVSGKLRRLTYAPGNQDPVATATTTNDPATRTVTFDASGSYDPDSHPLTYRWDFGDGTTGNGVRATHAYAAGTERFTAKLTVTDSLGATATAEIAVVPANHTPVIELTTPGERTFAVGEPVRLNATATDDEDGALTVSWASATLHCPEEASCHTHEGQGGEGATFELPFTDHPDSRVRVTATVTDSAGVSASRTYLALPREHRLTLTSNVPAGLTIPNEGEVSTALVTEGAEVEVSAAAVATDGVSTFARWSDGAAERVRTVTMGSGDLTLDARYTTPVQQRYDAEPQLRETLGAPTGPEVIEGGVYYRPYENGRLYWSAQTGTHEVHGPIAEKYVALGAHARFGPPTTDQRVTPDGVGRYNHFIGTPATLAASIYWTPDTGAHAVWGSIRERWRALGWERSPLGYPTIDERETPDGVGRYNHFSKGGSIYWTPGTGAHAVWGSIRERWRALGWEQGPLGYPTTDEKVTPDGVGRYNHFSKAGSIYWTPRTGAHEVYGAIRVRWRSLGWERSYLGYPTSGEYSVPGGRRNNFQRGYIRWYASSGAVIDRRY